MYLKVELLSETPLFAYNAVSVVPGSWSSKIKLVFELAAEAIVVSVKPDNVDEPPPPDDVVGSQYEPLLFQLSTWPSVGVPVILLKFCDNKAKVSFLHLYALLFQVKTC